MARRCARGGSPPAFHLQNQDCDTPGLETEDGIADIGFAWAAWIIDPAMNALGIRQIKE